MVLFLFVLFHPLRTPILGGAIEQGLAGAGSERKVSKSPDSAPEISDSGLMFFFSDFERVPVGHGVYEVEYKVGLKFRSWSSEGLLARLLEDLRKIGFVEQHAGLLSKPERFV